MKKILVVDDSELVHKVYKLMLSRHKDFHVMSAKSAAEADEILFKENRVDLIVLDVNMPSMNGLEYAEKLKGSGSRRDIPVLFVSSVGDEKYKDRALKLGAMGYVVKSRPEELSNIILRALSDSP